MRFFRMVLAVPRPKATGRARRSQTERSSRGREEDGVLLAPVRLDARAVRAGLPHTEVELHVDRRPEASHAADVDPREDALAQEDGRREARVHDAHAVT